MNLTETILPMPDDYEGKVIATLLRADSTAPSDRAVLYLHGYIDYFFQTHMAERFAGEEWNFYALDLRKYGRSLLTSSFIEDKYLLLKWVIKCAFFKGFYVLVIEN